MPSCPCGTGTDYESCCGPYIAGEPAPNPEALMRSRYTALTASDLDYIEKTCTEEALVSLNRFEMESSLSKTKFLGFQVREALQGDANSGSVTFSFQYRFKGQDFTQVEKAAFRNDEGRWLFDGSIVNPKPSTVRVESVGRNDPCACGSGKKYKKCCGAHA